MLFLIPGIILGMVALVFLESFFVSFLGFKLLVVLFFVLFRKIEWKYLFFIFLPIFLILDVIDNYTLGTNMFLISIPLGILIIGSKVLPTDYGVGSFVTKFVLFFIYYVLSVFIPSILLFGNFAHITWEDVVFFLIKSVVSVVLVVLFDRLFVGISNRGNISQIRLK